MKHFRFASLTLLGFTYLSCSSKPVEFYSTRKQAPQVVQRPQNQNAPRPSTKEVPPVYTTEAVAETPAATPKVSTETTTPISPAPVTPPAPDSSDALGLLRHYSHNQKVSDDLITNRLSTSELESAARDQSLANYRPLILWQLGQSYQKNKRS